MNVDVDALKAELDRLRLLREDEYSKLGKLLIKLGEERKEKAKKLFETIEGLDGRMRVITYRLYEISLANQHPA